MKRRSFQRLLSADAKRGGREVARLVGTKYYLGFLSWK